MPLQFLPQTQPRLWDWRRSRVSVVPSPSVDGALHLLPNLPPLHQSAAAPGHQAFACVNLLLLPPESDLNSLGIAFEAPELPCRREGLIRAEQPLDRWEPVGARQFLVPETFPAQAGGTPSSWVTRFLPTNARRLTCLEHTPLDPSEATGKWAALCHLNSRDERGTDFPWVEFKTEEAEPHLRGLRSPRHAGWAGISGTV